MNRYIAGLCFIWSAHSLAAQGLTLDQVFGLALEKTETLRIANSQKEQTQALVSQSQASFYPTLSATATYLRQKEKENSSIRPDQTTNKLTLSHSLYNGGRDGANLEAAKATHRSQGEKIQATRRQIYSDISKSFYDTLSLEQDIQNLSESIQLTQDRIIELKKRIAIGRSRTGELLTAQAQLSLLESQSNQLKGNLKVSRDQFEFLTGLNRETALRNDSDYPVPPQDIKFYLERATLRAELKSAQEDLNANREKVRAAKAGHLPTLDLAGNYYFTRTGSSEGVDWDASVALTLPLFEGGRISSQVHENRQREVEAELILQRIRRSIESEVRAAHGALVSSIAQMNALQRSLTTTEKNYAVQTKDYRLNLVTNLDVLQALNTFQDTKRSLDRARFSSLKYWSDLRVAAQMVPQ